MILSIVCSSVVLIILRLVMSSRKLGFFGNVLVYAVLWTLIATFISGFSIFSFIISFVVYFILGIPLIFALNKVDDYGELSYFIIVGLLIQTLIDLFCSWIISLFS